MAAWSHDGPRLFYHDLRTRELMAVRIRTGPTLSFDDAEVVATEALYDGGYDVAPNGRIVLARDEPPGEPGRQINVVLNWFVAAAGGQTSRLSRRTVPVSVSFPIDR